MAPTQNPDAARLQTFSRICFPHWNIRVQTRILRPERCEYSMIMGNQGDVATVRRETVFRLLFNSLVGRTGCRPLLGLAQNKRIITGVTAILFDQECSSSGSEPSDPIPMIDPAPWSRLIAPPLSVITRYGQSGARMVASLIEHMLLIDYGLGEQPLRPLGPQPDWWTNHMTRVVFHEFCKSLVKFATDCRNEKDISYHRLAWMDEFIQSYEDESSARDDFSDVALMFYFFWTRRRSISKDEYNSGLTGYTGVLDEMISEIPTVGTDRLTRKLSVDVNKLIPRYVRDEECRAEMIAVAKGKAMEHGIALRAPEYAFEYLTRPSTPSTASSERDVISRPGSVRNDSTASFERDSTPPPSYSEAMGLS